MWRWVRAWLWDARFVVGRGFVGVKLPLLRRLWVRLTGR